MHPRTRELLEFLEAERRILCAAVESVAPARREQLPAPGRWSAAGVVEHLAIVEARVSARLAPVVERARASGGPHEMSTDPILPTLFIRGILDRTTRVHAPELAHPTGLGFDAAWAALETSGRSVRALLGDADGLALAEMSAPHPLLGPLTFYQWFGFLGAHEARHAAQIREDYGSTADRGRQTA
jgi:hypothetical protein